MNYSQNPVPPVVGGTDLFRLYDVDQRRRAGKTSWPAITSGPGFSPTPHAISGLASPRQMRGKD